jgi:hypothetical protein
LLKHKADEPVTRVLIGYLSTWLHQTLPPTVEELVTEQLQVLLDEITAQHHIGWDNFFEGRLSIQWANKYNQVINNKNHGLQHPTAEKWGS